MIFRRGLGLHHVRPPRIARTAMASTALYLLLAWTQRRIALNGSGEVGGVALQGKVVDSRQLLGDLLIYAAITCVLFGLYNRLVARCRHAEFSKVERRIVFLGAGICHVGLLLAAPTFSFDVFSYVAHGALGAAPGGNPYLAPAAAALALPIGRHLVVWGWRPVHGITPYGPIWTVFEVMTVRMAAGNVGVAMVILKATIVGASLASARLIWLILGRVRPSAQIAGTAAYLWNPVILAELALDGHNDACMIALVLLGLLSAVTGRPGRSIGALLLGALAKIVPLVFVPAQFAYSWHTRTSTPGRFLGRVGGGLAVAVVSAGVFYAPFWTGAATFAGLTQRSGGSAAGALRMALFVLGVVAISVTARDARAFIRTVTLIALGYLLVGSPDYFPWYTALPIALLALTPDGAWWRMTLIVSGCARVVAPFNALFAAGLISGTTETLIRGTIGVSLPLVAGAIIMLRARRAGHQTATGAASTIKADAPDRTGGGADEPGLSLS